MTGWYRCEDCGEAVPSEPDPQVEVDGIMRVYCKLCAEEKKATVK